MLNKSVDISTIEHKLAIDKSPTFCYMSEPSPWCCHPMYYITLHYCCLQVIIVQKRVTAHWLHMNHAISTLLPGIMHSSKNWLICNPKRKKLKIFPIRMGATLLGSFNTQNLLWMLRIRRRSRFLKEYTTFINSYMPLHWLKTWPTIPYVAVTFSFRDVNLISFQ